MYNVKVKGVIAAVLSLSSLLNIRLCLFYYIQCALQNFPDSVIPHFSTNHFP